MVNAFYIIIIFICIQRLIELIYSNYNTKKLLNKGAKEYYKGHYPLFIILHSSWLASLVIFISPNSSINHNLLLIFILLQFLRLWVLLSLGQYWTTRIIRLNGSKLIKKGLYKWFKHPNYIIVFLELLILPLVFGSWVLAIIFTIFNSLLLLYRISLENKVLDNEI